MERVQWGLLDLSVTPRLHLSTCIYSEVILTENAKLSLLSVKTGLLMNGGLTGMGNLVGI